MANFDHIKNDIYRLRKYIFIGDSYGSGYTMSDSSKNWINKTISILRLGGSKYYKNAHPGSGFTSTANPSFLSLLQSITISDPHMITDIVVLGGWNDGDSSEVSIKSAIESFCNYCRDTFPIAKIWIGYISWCDTHTIDSSNPLWNVRKGYSAYSKCGQYGAAFLGNLQYAMHHTSFFLSDGLHPNESGQQEIANQLVTALQGGTPDVYYYNQATITKGSNISSCPSIWTGLQNENCFVDIFDMDLGPQIKFTNPVNMKAAGFHISDSGIIDVCTIENSCLRGGIYAELQTSVFGYIQNSSGTNIPVNILLRIGLPNENKANTLQVALNATNDTGTNYMTYNNVKVIWIPYYNVYLKGLSMFC